MHALRGRPTAECELNLSGTGSLSSGFSGYGIAAYGARRSLAWTCATASRPLPAVTVTLVSFA